MSLDDVVTLNITRDAPAVSRAGFGTMLILGPNATGWSSDRVRSYTTAAAMLDDGFDVSDTEYKAAVKAFSQEVKPARVKVGRRLTPVAMVRTLTPDVTIQEVTVYTATINGVAFSFTSDITPTATEVTTGLNALINAGSEPVTATGTTTPILTADQPGVPFTLEVSAKLAIVETTADVGVASDLAEISAIDNDWYGLVLVSRDVEEIFATATAIEAMRKVFVACSSAAGILTTATTDIASRLEAAAFSRTAILYSADQANMPEAAWLGRMLPTDPGQATWKFKTLAGITKDSLTDTQRTNAKGKKANIYTDVGGVNIAEEGVVASGEFIDVIVGIDWIHVNMQADVFQTLVDNDKIPFTNRGGAIFESVIRNRLRLAVNAGILADDPAPTVFVPLVADVDPADKAARRLTGMTFAGTLAGAVHAATINGSVTV